MIYRLTRASEELLHTKLVKSWSIFVQTEKNSKDNTTLLNDPMLVEDMMDNKNVLLLNNSKHFTGIDTFLLKIVLKNGKKVMNNWKNKY